MTDTNKRPWNKSPWNEILDYADEVEEAPVEEISKWWSMKFQRGKKEMLKILGSKLYDYPKFAEVVVEDWASKTASFDLPKGNSMKATNNIRIRYGARAPGHIETKKNITIVHRGTAKNTLATIRDGNVIYFGIARCSRGDTFKRSTGMQIALGRAQKAEQKGAPILPDDSIVFTDGLKSLRGYCSVGNIVSLLVYFQGLDSKKVGDIKWIDLKTRMMELAGIPQTGTFAAPDKFELKEWMQHERTV